MQEAVVSLQGLATEIAMWQIRKTGQFEDLAGIINGSYDLLCTYYISGTELGRL